MQCQPSVTSKAIGPMVTNKEQKAICRCAPFFFAEDGDVFSKLAQELGCSRTGAKVVFHKWLVYSDSYVAIKLRELQIYTL